MRLTAKQAADRAGVSRSLVYAWCRKRLVKHSRAGVGKTRGKIVIDEADLAAFLKSLEVEPAASVPLVSRHFS